MLALPEHGFQRSIQEHNVRLGILSDWIETSIVFSEDSFSQNDVIDILCENLIYEEQDFALVRVEDAWLELGRRAATVGDGAAFTITGRTIHRNMKWEDNPAYSFCVMLTVLTHQKAWVKTHFANSYGEQGKLFEELTAESLKCLGWKAFCTGWSPSTANNIDSIIEEISAQIGESAILGAVDNWLSKYSKDEQLDVVCFDPYYDGYGGRPLYLFQCASGDDWTTKLHTPDPDTWRRLIDFTTTPQRGFSMPFALLKDEFQEKAGKVKGFFLDRFRLQAPSYEGDVNWISKTLKNQILKWMKPRVKKLPNDQT